MPADPGRPVRLAVLGAGLIGRRHIEHVLAEPEAELAAIVDPMPAAKALADERGVPWFPSLAALVAAARPDGVIIATPNQLHVENGLEAVAAGLPALVEKPLADEVAEATRLVEAAEAAGVPLLTGHHRRHNPLLRAAKAAIDDGRLGAIVAVHGTCWLCKPDEYFAAAWRRRKGAGPILINLIHDVDCLRHLCGDVAAAQAQATSAGRGHEVEDSAVILLRFRSGALGTLSVSDRVVAPWSWELTSGESPAYPRTAEPCYLIGGTRGSLAIPQLDLWHNPTRPSWWEPIERARLPVTAEDPLRLQVRQLCRVIRGAEPPLVSGRDGLETLKVIAAIRQAAASGEVVTVD